MTQPGRPAGARAASAGGRARWGGTQARLLARVDRIIDETGRMLRLRDCIILEDGSCQGTFPALCRRKIYTYWREAWFRRIDPAAIGLVGEGPR